MKERDISRNEKEILLPTVKNILKRWLEEKIADDFEIPLDIFSNLVEQASIQSGLKIFVNHTVRARTVKDFVDSAKILLPV